ncbi:TetR/AcrR family transcriptional regulator [Sphingomonas sp. PL-96]|uniref:TetR/AcrR family transcriptional regulator n=1 Tax=Sphingomonas sp. PL-96 TaxID=2887201 RepID=UPI001E37D948|nr:TetR/AcrR family transcriptional regulator [Sphingomonas sp. PL-96]MCC2978086.1 TetR/AcrR family transcriptional regulator [Sphingomonas sp. PL-96]
MERDLKAATGKREARKQDRRLAIMAIARRMFLENGYAATSMSAIAAELGGSKATLWNYFPSKEELFDAVLDDATAAYRQQLTDLLRPTPDLGATVLAFTRSFIAKITSRDAVQLHRLVAAEAARSPEVGLIFSRVPQRTRQLLAEFFAAAMAAGQLRQADPADAANVVTYLCMVLQQRVLWGGAAPTAAEIEAGAATATEVFLRAYAPERSHSA